MKSGANAIGTYYANYPQIYMITSEGVTAVTARKANFQEKSPLPALKG
jgi:hypothetical protein